MCTYGRNRPSLSSVQLISHTKKKGCPAHIRFYCRGSKDERNVCVLSSFNERHNHEINEHIFRQDKDKIEVIPELSTLKDAIALNAGARQVKKMMSDQYDKKVSIRHVRNMMTKLSGPDFEKEKLASFLEQINLEGGKVEPLLDKNEKVRGLVIETTEMRKAYSGTKPTTVMIDTNLI